MGNILGAKVMCGRYCSGSPIIACCQIFATTIASADTSWMVAL